MHVLRRFVHTGVVGSEIVIFIDYIFHNPFHIRQGKIKLLEQELLFKYPVYPFCNSIRIRIIGFSHAGYDMIPFQQFLIGVGTVLYTAV